MFLMTKVKSRRFTKNVGRVNIMLFLYTIFDIYNPYGIKLLIRLRLGLSHLNERKFKHGFKEIINPICTCGGAIESKIISFSSLEYCEARQTPSDNIQSIHKMLLSKSESLLTHLLLFSDPKRNSNVNAFILDSATEFRKI